MGSEDEQDVKFPKRLRYRGKGKVLATIYRRPDCYRLYWRARVDGKPRSQFKDFQTYSAARQKGDAVVADLHKGAQAARLSPAQATDALAALERVQRLFVDTGRRVSLLAGISEYCEAVGKLGARALGEAVEGYLRTVASVKRKDIKEAVAEFLQADAPRTHASEGQRAQLSAKYAYNRERQLRRFAATFPNTAVCDLCKEHLDTFMAGLETAQSTSRNGRAAASAKSRNHYRATIRQFLQWAIRKDYLPAGHRLNEADGMRPERANTSETRFYTPAQFAVLLANADDSMRPILAIGGLAGLRTAELLRLDWADVWRVPGHIEITAGKAKTRQRRLVELCPALAAWLEPFRGLATGQLWAMHEITFQRFLRELCERSHVPRHANGLRHAFCTYHFALHQNENLTAALAGNSPAMIHAHYKGLATKAEAEKWFAVKPADSAENVIPLPASNTAQ